MSHQQSRYNKVEKIGEGTYGIVYKAKENKSGDFVALKCIRLESLEEGVPCTAIREICLLRELKHPNIVGLLDVVHSEKTLTLVFEYAEQDLKKFLDSHNGNIQVSVIRHLLRQLLQGIDYCHVKEVLHRDIKPQNLLVNKEMELKIADFGLGRAFGVPVRKYTDEVVTLWYRAPDVLLGSTYYGTPVDLWSVGCVLGEMASGQAMFAGKNDIDQLQRIFGVLGTLDVTPWPSARTYPKSNLLASPEIAGMKCQPSLASDASYSKLGNDGLALLQGLLNYEPTSRLSAKSSLDSPFFAVIDK